MKNVLTVTLSLLAVFAFADSAVAQQKGTQKRPPRALRRSTH
jgi:hypothetical protein